MTVNTQQDYRKKILTIPNLLSFFRLCLIPPIVWLYVAREDFVWPIVLLVVSGITDVVDGFVARKFNMVSDFGKAFDPIADKLTQFAMLICLLTRFPLMLMPVLVMFFKELLAGIMGLMTIKRTGKVTSAVWHGKANTVLLYAMIIVHLIWYDITPVQSSVLIGITTGVMIMSAVLYTMVYFNAIKGAKK